MAFFTYANTNSRHDIIKVIGVNTILEKLLIIYSTTSIEIVLYGLKRHLKIYSRPRAFDDTITRLSINVTC